LTFSTNSKQSPNHRPNLKKLQTEEKNYLKQLYVSLKRVVKQTQKIDFNDPVSSTSDMKPKDLWFKFRIRQEKNPVGTPIQNRPSKFKLCKKYMKI
jgi:hypothetical protein